MVYENYGSLNSFPMRVVQYVKSVRRTLRERWKADRFRRQGDGCALHPRQDGRPLTDTDVPLIVFVRNGVSRLPPFLAHYRSIGVTRFLVVDDGSTDGTREFLEGQPDIDLCAGDIRFSEARCGALWVRALVSRYGFSRWYLSVDVDEYLVYDGMDKHPLPDLFAALSRSRRSRLFAPMIDLLPESNVERAHFEPSCWPWEVAPLLNTSGYTLRFKSTGPLVEGGPLERIFGMPHLLQKQPVVFWDEATVHHPDVHNLYPYHRTSPAVLACLLHFKVIADLEERALLAIEDDQHVDHAVKYRAYFEKAREGLDLHAHSQDLIRYQGPEQLVDLGFMERIRWS